VKTSIRAAFPTLDSIRWGPRLSSLTYLRAVIDESMRLAPPVPGPLLRTALAGGVTNDVGAGDTHSFPAGTDLAVPALAIMRNPACYTDPSTFHPERWLSDDEDKDEHHQIDKHDDDDDDDGETTRNDKNKDDDDMLDLRRLKKMEFKRAHAAFCPFSIGPRGCVGRALAYVEMTVAVARLLWALDVRRAPGSRVGEDASGGTRGLYKLKDGFVVEKEGPVVQFRRRRV